MKGYFSNGLDHASIMPAVAVRPRRWFGYTYAHLPGQSWHSLSIFLNTIGIFGLMVMPFPN